MDDLRLVFASNLIKLRAEADMTQAALGEKLNYSDKTISKWERAESMPDVATLKKISEIFGVTIDELLRSDKPEISPGQPRKSYSISRRDLCRVVVISIWTLALLAFVILWMADTICWQIFLYCVPATLVAVVVFNSVWHEGKNNMYIVGSLVLSLFVVLYITFMDKNPWQIFLVAIPALLVVFFSFRVIKVHK